MFSTAKSYPFETIFCCTVPILPPPQLPFQPSLPADTVDIRDWENYVMDPNALDSPPYAHESADCHIKGPPGFLLRSQTQHLRPSHAGTRHRGWNTCPKHCNFKLHISCGIINMPNSILLFDGSWVFCPSRKG